MWSDVVVEVYFLWQEAIAVEDRDQEVVDQEVVVCNNCGGPKNMSQ